MQLIIIKAYALAVERAYVLQHTLDGTACKIWGQPNLHILSRVNLYVKNGIFVPILPSSRVRSVLSIVRLPHRLLFTASQSGDTSGIPKSWGEQHAQGNA